MTEAQRVDTGFAEVSGAPLYYEIAGAGHPLVLIHEGIADRRMYDDQFGAFAQRYRVIRYDVHGFGKSGIPAGPYSGHEALHDLLRVLGVERTYLLGMSMGGGIAIDFTLTYPTMVDALILAAAGVGGYTASDVVKQQWSEIGAALDSGDVAEAVELALRMWVDGPARAPDQVDPAVRERVGEMIQDSKPVPVPQPLEPPALSRLAEIHVPTLIIVGSGDVPDILAQADLLEQGIAGAQKVVIPGAAHVPNMERPRDFNRIVLDFLGTLKGS
jgi:3-oxoadipate enol-lactonase